MSSSEPVKFLLRVNLRKGMKIYGKYFIGLKAKDRTALVMKTLEAWFEERGSVNV